MKFHWAILTSLSLAIVANIQIASAAPDQIGLAVSVRNNVSQIEPSVSKILSGD
jgi:hypothetical protein